MRYLLLFTMIFCMVGVATAADLSVQAPSKSDSHVMDNPVFGDRQGGDTIADATPIPGLPYADAGATCQYSNDYDAVCPYTGSTSPDVVYSLVIGDDTALTVDLCGSGYDTKVYVVDAGLNVLACNDDFYFDDICGVYVSKIEDAFIGGGQTVYIVVDGYGGDCGDYLIDVSGELFVPCDVVCPGGGVLEGEPELNPVTPEDSYNGGCNFPEYGNPFQDILGTGGNHVDFCGKCGWPVDTGTRDLDWFVVVFDEDGAGFMDLTLDAEQATNLWELTAGDCNNIAQLNFAQVLTPCEPTGFTAFGTPGDITWIVVGAGDFYPPPGFVGTEYDYLLTIDGLEDGIIATEDASWSQVKGLFK